MAAVLMLSLLPLLAMHSPCWALCSHQAGWALPSVPALPVAFQDKIPSFLAGFFQLALPGIEHVWGVPELGRGERWASVTQGNSLTLGVAHLWSSSVAQRTRWELA